MLNLFAFLEVAREFGFTKLEQQALAVLKKMRVNSDNAIYILDFAKSVKDKDLEQNALQYIFSNGKKILTASNFVHISYPGLCRVILEDKLAVEEIEVFKAVIR